MEAWIDEDWANTLDSQGRMPRHDGGEVDEEGESDEEERDNRREDYDDQYEDYEDYYCDDNYHDPWRGAESPLGLGTRGRQGGLGAVGP